MKKLLCVLLAVMTVLALAACGDKTPQQNGGQQDQPAQSVDLKKAAEDAIASIGNEDIVLMPEEDTDSIEAQYPGLTAVETKQLVVYWPPVVGFGCELVMVEGDQRRRRGDRPGHLAAAGGQRCQRHRLSGKRARVEEQLRRDRERQLRRDGRSAGGRDPARRLQGGVLSGSFAYDILKNARPDAIASGRAFFYFTSRPPTSTRYSGALPSLPHRMGMWKYRRRQPSTSPPSASME